MWYVKRVQQPNIKQLPHKHDEVLSPSRALRQRSRDIKGEHRDMIRLLSNMPIQGTHGLPAILTLWVVTPMVGTMSTTRHHTGLSQKGLYSWCLHGSSITALGKLHWLRHTRLRHLIFGAPTRLSDVTQVFVPKQLSLNLLFR